MKKKMITKDKEISEKILKAFSKIVIHQCTMCGAFLTDQEFKDGEGVCLKHWDY
jgi:hypothetical protein